MQEFVIHIRKEKAPYLEWRLFEYGSESPSSSVLCSKPTVPFETPPCCPLSRQHSIYLHTDDINMPNSSSVWHTYPKVNLTF